MLKTTEWIVTTTELQQNVSIVLDHAQQRPLIVTQDGKPAAYVVSVDFFDSFLERLIELERQELGNNLEVAEQQFKSGAYLKLAEAIQAAESRWQAQETLNARS